MEPFFIAVVFIGIPMVLASIVKSINSHQRYMKVLQLKAEAHQRLLERFGNDPALLEFLKNDPEKLFDVSLPVEREPSLPYQRMLTAIQCGVVLLSIGAGLLLIKNHFTPRDQEPLLVFGAMGVASGVGCVLAAGAAYAAAKLWRRNGANDAHAR